MASISPWTPTIPSEVTVRQTAQDTSTSIRHGYLLASPHRVHPAWRNRRPDTTLFIAATPFMLFSMTPRRTLNILLHSSNKARLRNAAALLEFIIPVAVLPPSECVRTKRFCAKIHRNKTRRIWRLSTVTSSCSTCVYLNCTYVVYERIWKLLN